MTIEVEEIRASENIPAGAGPRRNIRPMTPGDVPAVGRLFNRIFRGHDRAPGDDLGRYIETVFFGSPQYHPDLGSVVHENAAGGIDSAILSVPMAFMVNGHPITARLLCAFMAESKAGAVGAARLARSMRAARQDMCFSDNASPVSADHWAAGGGLVLPIQSLEWQRSFLPLTAAAILASRHLPVVGSPILLGILGLVDRALRRLRPSMRPKAEGACRIEPAGVEEFLECAIPMLERFAIRPAWSKSEFDWLVHIASMNRSLGALECRKVVLADGRTIGAFLFFRKPTGIATVLNLVTEEGRERDIAAAMFARLDAEGYALAVGMAQPFLMNAISRQRWLSFRHRGYFCLVTRHAELRQAAERNDIYIGGLASETWSRLLTDF
ncbi:GNAT family N-acetyltransferase [Sinorhizobium medicae]|uniref:GNAT family N-acetyltransferase n=1 Tax=Sinorhizobium medicae TaxID=110321 RepID=UPI001AAF314B|nr:GNAT family N-acetyltransferase [Sinorhizobium medicae]MBO1961867.1 GNAT family N-acetyltransferase [Sinorhizobium medicae]WQP41807.1 GNAT family N-acetyltransferase [Sinorhizobium medicae]